MKRILVVVGLLVMLVSPCSAYASPLDSFGNGLSDFVTPETGQTVETQYEQDYEREYTPVLREVQTVEVEEGDALSNIQGWIQSFKIPFNSAQYGPENWHGFLYSLFVSGYAGGVFPTVYSLAGGAAVFCMLWWGLRKAIRMLMAAFKGRKLNV